MHLKRILEEKFPTEKQQVHYNIKMLFGNSCFYTDLFLTESRLQKLVFILGGRLIVRSHLVSERSRYTLQYEFQAILINETHLLMVYEKTC